MIAALRAFVLLRVDVQALEYRYSQSLLVLYFREHLLSSWD